MHYESIISIRLDDLVYSGYIYSGFRFMLCVKPTESNVVECVKYIGGFHRNNFHR